MKNKSNSIARGLVLALIISTLAVCFFFVQLAVGAWSLQDSWTRELLFWTSAVLSTSLGGLMVLKKQKLDNGV